MAEGSIPESIPEPELAFVAGTKNEGGLFDAAQVKVLDLGLRRYAGWGALILALVFYALGIVAIALFLGIFPFRPAVGSDHWHIVVAVLVALFSVPTFLLLSVFRSTSAKEQDHQSLHEAVGNRVLNLLENLTQRRGD